MDSTASSSDALSMAKLLARDYQCVVAVSGEVDYVSNQNKDACAFLLFFIERRNSEVVRLVNLQTSGALHAIHPVHDY